MTTEKLDIKQLRENKNLTQSELAEKLGVSRSIIAKIESKEIDISKKIMEKLINSFPEEIINYKNIYNYTHLFTQDETHLKAYNEFSHPVEGVDFNYYFNQNLEYEQMQRWLIKIFQLLHYEYGRKFNESEKSDFYSCITNIKPPITSYIKQHGEENIKNFLNERKTLTKELIDKYLKEYFDLVNKTKGYSPEFDFL